MVEILSDIEIASQVEPKPIKEIAQEFGINVDDLELYGEYKAKINVDPTQLKKEDQGKLILVTAITPTAAGEGKTTTSVGLADALAYRGKNAFVAVREPSLGPVFGVKGGATGGGHAQVTQIGRAHV